MAQPSGTTKELLSVFFSDTANGFIVGIEGTILRTQNGGIKWTAFEGEFTNDLRAVQFFDKQQGIIVGTNGTVLRTTDSGTTWIKVETDFPLTLFGLAIN
jgi:photosystem II stability/assembly factor-like uncharacterized protein